MELISYAGDFVSFVLENLNELEKIKSIILFGSVARGEETKDSDVDLFFDTDDKKIGKKIETIRENFFKSVKYKNYWKLHGIDNEINIISGKLDEWELKDSIAGNSILLYGKYSPRIEKGINKVIISWKNPKNNSLRVMITKKISGYKHTGRSYKGILETYNGKKLGANTIIADVEGAIPLMKIFRHFKANAKILRVLEIEK
jgi:predicted nucleotidyltransferase